MVKKGRKRTVTRYVKKAAHRTRKWTPIRIGKHFIALFPTIMDVVEAWRSGGPKAAGNQVVKNYAGWDRESHTFNAWDLADGYIPMVGAWGFGKVASRVLR